MNVRYFSLFFFALAISSNASAQNNAAYYTDPATGIVYQPVTRTVERPVVETKIRTENRTVYRPETVTEIKPQSRTIFVPVVEYAWEPQIHGRWNPFRQPYVAYQHVPRMRWQARNDVIQHRSTQTQWVAETQQVNIPERIVRMERQQKTDLEPVGRVAPTQVAGNPPSSIASRLHPLQPGVRIAPLHRAPSATVASARTTVGNTSGYASARTADQEGMPAKTLYRAQSPTLPPSSTATGIARMPTGTMFR